MKRLLKGLAAALITAALCVPVCSYAGYEQVTAQIPVNLGYTDTTDKKTVEPITVVLQEKDNAPMPAEATAEGYKKTFTTGAEDNFINIAYSRPGIYWYDLKQEMTDTTRNHYDKQVFRVRVIIKNAEEEGKLVPEVAFFVDGNGAKQDGMFRNDYDRSSSGGGGGGSSHSGGSTTAGPGVTEITDPEVPTTTILPFDIPLALPQTGTLWWLVPIFAAAGIVLFVGGVVKNRKKDEEEL
ncbi:MAG: Spy0128 family protein [Brotaphodocola sp.]